MGSFLTTCFKSLSTLCFLKVKLHWQEKTQKQDCLYSCASNSPHGSLNAALLSISTLYFYLEVFCHVAWKHPFSVPTGLQVFTKAQPQLKSKGNSRYWPVARDMLAYSSGLTSASTHVVWGPPSLVFPGEDLFAHPEYFFPGP